MASTQLTAMWIVFTAAVATCAAAEPQLHGAASALLPAAEPTGSARTIHLHPRYVRLYTDPGVELAAANYRYKTLDWDVPAGEIALVCLDCWNWHFSRDTFEQMEKVVRERIVPLLAAWRAEGMLVIHAPAGPVAQRHPNWTRLTAGKRSQAVWPDSPNWPPAEFKRKTGLYAKYARPQEPLDFERSTHAQKKRDFHPLIRPVGDEPVVLDGEELHRLCAQRRILHLVYVGFNTNACIMLRDYGLPAMNRRGYTTILVRDGTFGMETATTCQDSACTRGAIADLEQFGSYTLSSREIVDALTASGKLASGGDQHGMGLKPNVGFGWKCVMTLDERRRLIAGDPKELRAAIGRGADLRIYSEFIHNEHIDPKSPSAEPIQESMDMRCTYLIDQRWVAGLLTLRQPVELPLGFGPRPSLSLFLYNENGEQAIARPFLDGPPKIGPHGPAPVSAHADMPKYHEFDSWDAGTNAPSSNFAYDFGTLKYFVRDDWIEVLAHDADGKIQRGSMAGLMAAFRRGAEFKVGMTGLCEDLSKSAGRLPHEVFIECGSVYLYTQQPLFIAATHPVVRVAPAIPLRYASENWDYSWLVVRTDGRAALLRYDPYTLRPIRTERKLALRWFAR